MTWGTWREQCRNVGWGWDLVSTGALYLVTSQWSIAIDLFTLHHGGFREQGKWE